MTVDENKVTRGLAFSKKISFIFTQANMCTASETLKQSFILAQEKTKLTGI